MVNIELNFRKSIRTFLFIFGAVFLFMGCANEQIRRENTGFIAEFLQKHSTETVESDFYNLCVDRLGEIPEFDRESFAAIGADQFIVLASTGGDLSLGWSISTIGKNYKGANYLGFRSEATNIETKSAAPIQRIFSEFKKMSERNYVEFRGASTSTTCSLILFGKSGAVSSSAIIFENLDEPEYSETIFYELALIFQSEFEK